MWYSHELVMFYMYAILCSVKLLSILIIFDVIATVKVVNIFKGRNILKVSKSNHKVTNFLKKNSK